MEFHEKLQELRKQKKLTQEELSEVLFVSRTAISKWESGRGYPSIDSLKAIAEYFGITIDELDVYKRQDLSAPCQRKVVLPKILPVKGYLAV